jgi:predicted Zn-dependent peptidase
VTSESLPLVIDLEAERLANLDISQATLDSEREVVLEERRMRTETRPGGLAIEALFGLTWQALPYRWPVIGWRSDVEAVTVAACREFFDTYYSANNIALVIVGDFDTNETLARVRRAFGRIRRAQEIPRNPTREREQQGERRALIYHDVRVPLLYAAWHAPQSGHPDAEALDIASQVLSGGRSSRLYRSLVYEQERALYAEGGYWELQEAGIFYAVAGVRPGVSVDEVESLFFAEIDRIRDEGVSEAEVERAKRQLEVALVSGLSASHALANRIGSDALLFGRVRPLAERLAAIDAVTAADVQRVVRLYLRADRRSVVHVVSPPAGPEAEVQP